jgi:NTE family protein
MTARAWRPAAVALAAFLTAGCASFPETGRLEKLRSGQGLPLRAAGSKRQRRRAVRRPDLLRRRHSAAAFSYGVLEELRKTTVAINGERRNLLKEADLISSISGGSFTAAYYGLRGDEIFQEEGRFQRNFLYRDVQGELIGSLFNPYNWLRLASPTFGRIELATELYQELLFDNATFRDLERQARKPYLMINATDMTKGSGFTFVQPQFDPLCADLDTVLIARAVAASSNFPIAFTPLTLNSYPGSCNYTEPPWVENALNDLDVNPRRYYSARLLRTYQEKNRGYIHLLDGGVADNIGLRGPLTSLTSGDVSPSILNKLNNKQIKKLVVIVVDAKNETPNAADQSPSAPICRRWSTPSPQSRSTTTRLTRWNCYSRCSATATGTSACSPACIRSTSTASTSASTRSRTRPSAHASSPWPPRSTYRRNRWTRCAAWARSCSGNRLASRRCSSPRRHRSKRAPRACVRKERIKYNLRFDEVAIRVGVHGALSVMRYLRMLPSRRTRQRRIEPLESRSSGWVRASQSGILRTLTPLGARVEAHPYRLGSSFLRQPVTESA